VNPGPDRRVVDIVVGGALKAVYSKADYSKAAHDPPSKQDRPGTIKDLQEMFLEFGCGSPEEVDMLAEGVSFA